MPRQATGRDIGIIFDPDGLISVGQAFREFEAAWNTGLAAMARAGVGVIIDEVFLGASASQARLESALEGLDVLWVGVYCDADVAAGREAARQDRVRGMAAAQAGLVHSGVHYDIQVDTTDLPTVDCARTICERVIH
jgi:chloramphenicol 3-O phosphotransferase